MKALQFEQAVEAILKREKRYDPLAYVFLKEALDFTVKRATGGNPGEQRHVSGTDLCVGYRDLALEQFGPMAATLMNEWGVRGSADIGEMVFHLIDEQMFGKQDSDTKEDFAAAFDFDEAFVMPFQPKKKRAQAADVVAERALS